MGRMSTTIVGTNFRGPGAKSIVERLNVGTTLRLMRESSNKYDRNAVMVCYASTHIGYLSRGVAQDIARLLDGKIEVACVKLNPQGTGFIELTWGDDIGTKPTELKVKRIEAPTPPKLPSPRRAFPEIDLDAAPLPDPWE